MTYYYYLDVTDRLFWSKVAIGTQTCECKQAKRRECLPGERLVQGQKHAVKKALLATLTISKSQQQRNTIPNSANEEINCDEHVKATQG